MTTRLIRATLAVMALVGALAGCDWITNASHACSYGAHDPAMSGSGRYVVFSAVCVEGSVTGGELDGRGVGPFGLSVSQLFVRDLRTDVTTGVTYATNGSASTNTAVNASVSDDGRLVVFASPADDLVPGDTNAKSDVFVRNLATGATTRLSATTTGVEGNGHSQAPAITADGHTVSFVSQATNLVPGTPTGTGTLLVDTATRALTLPLPGGSSVAWGEISADGKYVLLTRYQFGASIGLFVHDLATGNETRVDLDKNGGPPNGEPTTPSISDGGRYVAWTTTAEDLVSGDTFGSMDVFVRDLQTNVTRRVSAPITDQGQSIWANDSHMSRNGRFVAFWVSASSDTAQPNPLRQYYIADRATGAISVASATNSGTPSDWGNIPPSLSLSGDGRYLAFASDAKNLDDNDDGVIDIYVRFVIRPTVTSATPSSLTRGTTTTVTLHGLGFLSDTTIAVSGTGVTINSVTAVNATTLTAVIQTAADATTGGRDVTPTNPGTGPGSDRGSTAPACSGCITITG